MDVERIDRIPDSFPGRTAGRVGGAAPDYEPLLPRWTRHGGLLLMVFAVAMLPAATFLRFDTYQRVRATLVDHGPDRVLILSGGVPAQAMPAIAANLSTHDRCDTPTTRARTPSASRARPSSVNSRTGV